jgi:hypothetical protein
MPHTPGHFSESEIVIGCPVYTRDGERLGDVKEVRAGALKIDAAMQPDYWLSTGHIDAVLPDRLTLAFPKDALDDYKLDSPDKARMTDTSTTRQAGTMRTPTDRLL